MRRLSLLLASLALIVGLVQVGSSYAASRYGKLLDKASESDTEQPWVFSVGAIRRPRRFYVRTRTSPRRATVTFSWFLTCDRGRRRKSSERTVRRRGRSLLRIKPNLRRASYCDISLTAEQAVEGTVKLRLYGKRR